MGADGYFTAPFDWQELLARIRATVRRRRLGAQGEPQLLVLGDLGIDFQNRTVKAKDSNVHLAPKEFELVRCLTADAGKVISHRRLLQAVWGADRGDKVQCLHVVVSQLRRRIEPEAARPRYIVTDPRLATV